MPLHFSRRSDRGVDRRGVEPRYFDIAAAAVTTAPCSHQSHADYRHDPLRQGVLPSGGTAAYIGSVAPGRRTFYGEKKAPLQSPTPPSRSSPDTTHTALFIADKARIVHPAAQLIISVVPTPPIT